VGKFLRIGFMFGIRTFIQVIVDKLVAVNCVCVSIFKFFNIQVCTASTCGTSHTYIRNVEFLNLNLGFRIHVAFALSLSVLILVHTRADR
jgi:hypothetical protein